MLPRKKRFAQDVLGLPKERREKRLPLPLPLPLHPLPSINVNIGARVGAKDSKPLRGHMYRGN